MKNLVFIPWMIYNYISDYFRKRRYKKARDRAVERKLHG